MVIIMMKKTMGTITEQHEQQKTALDLRRALWNSSFFRRKVVVKVTTMNPGIPPTTNYTTVKYTTTKVMLATVVYSRRF